MTEGQRALAEIVEKLSILCANHEYVEDLFKPIAEELEAAEAAKEKEITFVVYDKYYDLCGNFLKACRDNPDTPWGEIPEAVTAMKELRQYKLFVNKYFGINLDRETN